MMFRGARSKGLLVLVALAASLVTAVAQMRTSTSSPMLMPCVTPSLM
jgi:hypothetical protein